MKNKVGWHEECLKNMKRNFDREMNVINGKLEDASNLSKRIQFYRFQIEEAKKIKKGFFDRERFRVKRETKCKH